MITSYGRWESVNFFDDMPRSTGGGLAKKSCRKFTDQISALQEGLNKKPSW